MAKEKDYKGPFEVRGRRTGGAQEELLGAHTDLDAAELAAHEAVERHGYEVATVIDQPSQDGLVTVHREAPPA